LRSDRNHAASSPNRDARVKPAPNDRRGYVPATKYEASRLRIASATL
jgi:hypothetical protein